MNDLLIPLLLFGGNQRLTRQLLPLAIPGPPGQRLAVGAVFASQEIKKQEQVDLQVVREAIAVGSIKDLATLTKSAPTIAKLYAGLKPADQASIVFGGTAAGKTG